eukprot:TRINITY_DN3182_c3_g1_i1.p1 TRINITY_DN3182_c3_g1~~TRINITY_DN3182_c3_g1_i1.p1  ORF type:complete len:538 (-),score=217.87 TRINITY_DN3182_c3_g1_i1:32-1621(-)
MSTSEAPTESVISPDTTSTSTTSAPTTASTSTTTDNNNNNNAEKKVNSKPISGPAAGAKKKEAKEKEGGGGKEKGKGKGKAVTGDDDDQQQQRRRADMIITEPVKGTRDFAPDDMRVRNWLFGHWREVARLFAFQEFDTPILEHEELYVRKAGEEITAQMYNFKDKADRPVALRPELTPSLARLILKLGNQVSFPLKWFSIPQCWRFEQTTRGRKREHYQWNMDIIGVSTIGAEAELLAAIVTFFKRVGFTSDDIAIRVNSRKVLQAVLDKLGVTGDKFMPTCIVIDKLDKLSREEVSRQLKEIGLNEEAIEGILESTTVKSIDELSARTGEDNEAVKELRELFALAKAYSFEDWIKFDASVIRGLSYYTGVVFEAIDKTGALPRAICGGGRYDKLFQMFGANQREAQPCAGFGFGDCVIIEILKDKNLIPETLKYPSIDDVIAVQNDTLLPAAMTVASLLRTKGRSVDVILNKKKNLGWAYTYADRLGADRVVLVAPSEWENKTVKIKEMKKGKDDTSKELVVSLSDL